MSEPVIEAEEIPAEARHRWTELAEQVRRAPVRVLRPGRADRLRRRVRRAAARAGGAGGASTRPAHPGLARPSRSAARSRPSSARSTTWSGCSAWTTCSAPTSCGPGLERVGRDAGRGPLRLPVRAEDRRAGDQPALRAGPAGPGRHPRRRADRRGRHAQRPHHPGRPARAGRVRRRAAPGAGRGPGRGLLPGRGVRRAERAPGRGGQGAVREPAQRRRRLAAAEGPAGHREPRRCGCWCTGSAPGEGFDLDRQSHGYELLQGLGAAGQRDVPGGRLGRRGAGVRRVHRRAPARPVARDRRRRGQGGRRRSCSAGSARPAGPRAGRSRSSTRRRR